MVKYSYIKEKVRQYPSLVGRKLFFCYSKYPDITIPFRLLANGNLKALNNLEYASITSFLENEFFPLINKNTELSVKEKDLLIRSVHSKRDFFSGPNREGKNFQKIIEEIENIKENENECSGNDGSTKIFLPENENSKIHPTELILYCFIKSMTLNYSFTDNSEMKNIHTILTKIDESVKFEEVIDYLHTPLFGNRADLLDEVVKSFCFFNCNDITSALRGSDSIFVIFNEAKLLCENLNLENINPQKLNVKNPIILLKYFFTGIKDEVISWNHKYCEKSAYFWTTSEDPTIIEKKITVNNDLTWSVHIFGKESDFTWKNLPPKINSVTDFNNIIYVVNESQVCPGFQYNKFEDVLQENIQHNIVVLDSQVSAVIHNDQVRSISCSLAIPSLCSLGTNLCYFCHNLRNILYSKRFNKKNQTDVGKSSKFKTFKHKTKEEIQSDYKNLSENYKKLEKEYQKIKDKLNETEKVFYNDDKDLREMFNNLKDGINEITNRVENPICKWNNCSAATFHSLSELLIHMEKCHITQENESNTVPINKQYKCEWGDCKLLFDKKCKLQKHISDNHTGKESDIFLKFLLQDQAKALVTPSKQMRWHPMVIKFCLANYKSQKSHDELRNSGFLKLPSGRLLHYYRKINQQSSGWNYENINEMNKTFEKSDKSIQSKIGALIFDEIKIKEGLIWSAETNELLGFSDFQTNNNNTEDSVASNILQFFFKSLFSNFSYPCAYICVKNLNGLEVSTAFWQGVDILHRFGFITLVSICDGASENRNFINASCQVHPDYPNKSNIGVNPYTKGPIFFISDPPHLIKKLRNNLFSSGHKDFHKRLLHLQGKEIIWDHIISVFKRENKRSLPVTKLNSDAVYLNNFSKMRVNLAANTLSHAVVNEMKQNENEATSSTQKYIQQCANLFDILNSSTPIKDDKDERLKELININQFFYDWEYEVQHLVQMPSDLQKNIISWQTLQDLHLTITSFFDLIKYINTVEFKNKYPCCPYIIPKRLSQDIVESWFSLQRGCCGAGREPTVMQYGHNNAKLLSVKKAKADITGTSYGTTDVNEVQESQDLKILKTGNKRKLTWPLDV